MTTTIKTCPKCNGRLRISHTRQLSVLIERYRHCRDCQYRDRVLCEPEVVFKVFPLSFRSHTEQSGLSDSSKV